MEKLESQCEKCQRYFRIAEIIKGKCKFCWYDLYKGWGGNKSAVTPGLI